MFKEVKSLQVIPSYLVQPLKANSSTHLAMSQMAKQLRTASPKKQQTENEAYAFRCWMLRLGFIGEEFKTARTYFMRNFKGNCAWRHRI